MRLLPVAVLALLAFQGWPLIGPQTCQGTNKVTGIGADGTVACGVDQTGAGGGLDAGLIVLSLTSCPSGYAEETTLSGKFVLGTLAANGDVTGTGGADNITPAGTNTAPTFTGTSSTVVVNHTHTVSVTDPGHVHTQASQTATTGSASSWEHGVIDTSSTASETLNTGSATTGITATTANPAGGAASYTPAGTVSAPAFTGTQFDNRPAFVKVLFCKKS
jgi:hypothetical protein